MSELIDLGGKYTQQARRLYVESDGWIRGHHVPGAIAACRTRARLFDVSPSPGHLRMYYESLLKLEREIELYHHRMAQLRILLTRLADETLADLNAMQDEKPAPPEAWNVITPFQDEDEWLETNRNLHGQKYV